MAEPVEQPEQPEITHEQLIAFILDRNREDKDRASDAGSSRQKIGAFIEETGVNGQALSWMRSTVKKLDKKDGQLKALDIIGSLEALLPMIKEHVVNAGTKPMDLPAPGEAVGPETGAVVPFQ